MIRSKLPTATTALIRSVYSVGAILDQAAVRLERGKPKAPSAVACARVSAATCYQAAIRLEELATLVEEIAPIVDPRKIPRARK